MTISPNEIPLAQFMNLVQSTVAPRPIAFASTIDAQNRVNLSPFSFFNVFSINPPILIFSPARRVRNNTTKHTLENVLEVPEVVINIVDYAMVQQCSLASTEYEKGVDEFEKAGFVALKSDLVRPPRVANSPASFECKVNQVIPLGSEGGAGNLVVCEIVKAHFSPHIFDENGTINPQKMDLVARLGGDWYARITSESLFQVAKPVANLGIGIDALPAHIWANKMLSGNDLGKLGNVERLPMEAEVAEFKAAHKEMAHNDAFLAKLLEENAVFDALCFLM